MGTVAVAGTITTTITEAITIDLSVTTTTTTTTTKVMTIVANVVAIVAATGNNRCSAHTLAAAVVRAATRVVALDPVVALLLTTDATAPNELIGNAKALTRKLVEMQAARDRPVRLDHHPFRVKQLLRCP